MVMEETLELSGLFYRLSGQDLGDSFPEFVVQEEAGRQESFPRITLLSSFVQGNGINNQGGALAPAGYMIQ
jgi:hypothetical protein